MAATLPWRRDEEPAQLPRLAPHSGGVGPKDHARGFYLWSHRIRPISTINAVRAKVFDWVRADFLSPRDPVNTPECSSRLKISPLHSPRPPASATPCAA